MNLRLNTLLSVTKININKKTVLFLLVVLVCPIFSQNTVSLNDVKKEADRLFEDDEFTKAYKPYSQLVSNFPKDPEYNYRLGVCMIYSEPDKKKCIPYLKTASSNPKEAPKDVTFYLGKAYHINYMFDEAIKYYNEYKKIGSSSQQKKLQVDREIKSCENGKHLLSNLSDLVVQNKKQLNEVDYFRSYDLKSIGGKLLIKPEEFRTNIDKKKKEKSIVFLPKGSNVVYFSSYGDNLETGKDIYTSAKLSNNTYSKPEKVKGINTEFDEDYPFLHPDGKTLYFASKGYNSMGGYDVFKSVFNEETNTWSSPINLEFPINSPDDDFLFVTDSLEKTAYFSTGRQSPPGKIDVLKINTERKPIDILVIKGTVSKENNEQNLNSNVTVKKADSDELVGNYTASDKGEYIMDLPNGSKLLFTVETPGLKTQTDTVTLPLATTSKPYKQTITYTNGILKIINYFDESANDDNYLQYLKIIEKKAKLDVNEGENKLSIPLAVNDKSDSLVAKPKKKNTSGPEIIEQNDAPPVVSATETNKEIKKGVDNKQLANIAKQDAEESNQEAKQLHLDAAEANEIGEKQKIEADKKLDETNEAIKTAEALTNEDEKKSTLEKLIPIKQAAENDQLVASKILSYSKSLEEDAKVKDKETELNKQYARELENSSNPTNNNVESLKKLEELQKQIAEVSEQKKNSEILYGSIKDEVEQKEKQIATIEKTNSEIKTNLEEIKTAINNSETELSKTKKKAAKENIINQIAGFKTDQAEKEKQIANNDIEIKKLNEELTTIKNELDLTTKIKTETIAITSNPTNSLTQAAEPPKEKENTVINTPNTNSVPQKISNQSLKEKYKEKLTISDTKNKLNLEENSNELKQYNKEIDQALAKNKADLVKAKNNASKQLINNEIKQLEITKKQNQQQIASNTKLMGDLNKPLVNAEGSKTTLSPITTTNSSEAITLLDNLSNQLNQNDNENFEFNSYQNPQAQNLKIEADSKINDAIAKQKKLKEDISTTKSEIQKTAAPTNNPVVSVLQLNKEAEEFHNQSIQLNTESKTKQGDEKNKLLFESKILDEKANEKYIQASEVTKQDNNSNFETNKINIQNLINANKSSESEITSAKKLNDEANLAFKQALTIRTEANAQANSGAKLGTISNAEEKEAEAIIKQQQSVDLLKKANPDISLKIPALSTDSLGTTNNTTTNLSSSLETVNTGISEVVNTKINSYQKLYEANNLELDQLLANLKANQSALDGTPSLKSEFIAGINKLENAKKLNQNAETQSDSGEKLESIVSSIKKQNDALKLLSTLSASASKLANNTLTTSPSNADIIKKDTLNTESEKISANQPEVTKKDSVIAEVKPVEVIKETVTPENKPKESISEIDLLSKNDTTTEQLLSYFDQKNLDIKNPEAQTLGKNAIAELKNIENENRAIENEIKNYSPETNALFLNKSPSEIKAKADSLLLESEELTEDALITRNEAKNKTGDDKNSLIAKAKGFEKQSQDNKLKAASFYEKANEREYETNNTAIEELFSKLKLEKPELYSELAQKNSEASVLKKQSKKLRQEADALTNIDAKLGGISNAEEKEVELLQKQNQVITLLKKQYPDYVIKPLSNEITESKTELPAELLEKKNQNLDKQYAELTNLTNAFSLEYETSKNAVPTNLSVEQQNQKKRADNLNSESKRILIKSVSEKNEKEKVKLLTLSVKLGKSAIEELNKVLPDKVLATNSNQKNAKGVSELETIGNTIADANNERTAASPVKKTAAINNTKTDNTATVKIDGLEVIKGNAYNASKPIPIDAKIEDGLVFRVQIGAFKTQLPNDAFRGLSPLNAETTANGYYRYTAGNFNKFETANAVKNDLRGLGYRDAFVVGYYNGKRVSVSEALALLNKEGKNIDANAPQSAGITANSNIPKAAIEPVNNTTNPQDNVVVAKELEKINGLLFTVQIGVYSKQVTKQGLLNLKPIFSELLPNGLFRYTAGIYNTTEKITNDKRRLTELGFKDAFISSYLNGKRISFQEGQDRQKNDSTIKMEPENPIIFSEAGIAPTLTNNQATSATTENVSNNPIQPFSNGINNYPTPTAENGIKTGQDGICFKVQIGAYSKQVPKEVADKFLAIKNWPLENNQINTLFIYTVGNFSDAKFAKQLKNDVVKLGLSDAFISVYRDGKKLYGNEASNLIGR